MLSIIRAFASSSISLSRSLIFSRRTVTRMVKTENTTTQKSVTTANAAPYLKKRTAQTNKISIREGIELNRVESIRNPTALQPRSRVRVRAPVCLSRWYRRSRLCRWVKTSRATLRVASCVTRANMPLRSSLQNDEPRRAAMYESSKDMGIAPTIVTLTSSEPTGRGETLSMICWKTRGTRTVKELARRRRMKDKTTRNFTWRLSGGQKYLPRQLIAALKLEVVSVLLSLS
mmetsp:Transcript_30689/g.49648  ORF Transcript_30689/g.49648 Transcript_30689/m.49648 type:complete len:231 (+) Transcript_30689:1369-2061(+)